MLHNLMGRQKSLEGIQSFIAHFIEDPDHPVLQDFVAHMRPYAPDPWAYDIFASQVFFNVVLPEYTLQDASRESVDDDLGGFEVRTTVLNAGTGRMPVEISAQRGVRFPGHTAEETEEFQGKRIVLELGAGESREVSIRCQFEPERIVIDPDAKVLQRGRKFAIHRF